MRIARLVLPALFVIASVSAPAALAQTTPDLEEGMKPYGDFHGGDIDQISLSSGKLALNIPLISYPQRGGKVKLGFGLRWQNSTPRQTEVYHSNTNLYQEQLFRDANSAATGQLDFVDNLGGWLTYVGSNPTWVKAWSPDNSTHNLLYVSSNAAFESNEATGMSYIPANNTLIMPDGVRHIYSSPNGPLAKVEDPNGNFVTPTLNSTWQITAWTDTLGRSIATPLSATSTTDYSHCTGANPIGAASIWTVPGPNGGTETFKFCYAGYSYSFQSDVGGQLATASGTLTMLQSIVLPNLTTWTFQYEPTYAALSQITLPTGGTISYTDLPPGSAHGIIRHSKLLM